MVCTLSRIGLNKIMLLEEMDLQYNALKTIRDSLGCRQAYLIAVANALVSYRLTGYGEDYWMETAEYFTRKKPVSNLREAFMEFLLGSKYNRLLVDKKLKRLEKLFVSKTFSQLRSNPSSYCRDLYRLCKELAKIYGQDTSAKTIVFAVKMYSYVCRLCEGVPAVDRRIDIPVDKRVVEFTILSRLVTIPGYTKTTSCGIKKIVDELLSKHRKIVVKVWKHVSKETGIPPLQLDTVIWLLTKYIKNSSSCSEFIRKVGNTYNDIIPEQVLREICGLVLEHKYT